MQELIHISVKKYDTFTSDEHSEYFGENDFKASFENKYASIDIAAESDEIKFLYYLKIHQREKQITLRFE